MLGRILVRFIKPYWPLLLLVLVFQAAQSIASLWLPSLNAEIIDDGIATGDVGLILRLGGLMLVATIGQTAASIKNHPIGLPLMPSQNPTAPKMTHPRTFATLIIDHSSPPSG